MFILQKININLLQEVEYAHSKSPIFSHLYAAISDYHCDDVVNVI